MTREVEKEDVNLRLPVPERIEREPGPGWRGAYPALLSCLVDGRAPSSAEIDSVALRMAREVGTWARQPGTRAGSGGGWMRNFRKAARAALVGRDCDCSKVENPLAVERQ